MNYLGAGEDLGYLYLIVGWDYYLVGHIIRYVEFSQWSEQRNNTTQEFTICFAVLVRKNPTKLQNSA